MRIQLVGFIIGLGGVGLPHQVCRSSYVFFSLGLDLLDLLADRVQIFGFFVVAFITMASVAAAPPEQFLAGVDGGKLNVAAGEHHVGRVATLAAGFGIFFGIQRPEPVLVVA